MERNEAISEANALLSKCNNDWVKGVEVLDVAIFHDTLEVLMKHRGVTDFVSGVNSSRLVINFSKKYLAIHPKSVIYFNETVINKERLNQIQAETFRVHQLIECVKSNKIKEYPFFIASLASNVNDFFQSVEPIKTIEYQGLIIGNDGETDYSNLIDQHIRLSYFIEIDTSYGFIIEFDSNRLVQKFEYCPNLRKIKFLK